MGTGLSPLHADAEEERESTSDGGWDWPGAATAGHGGGARGGAPLHRALLQGERRLTPLESACGGMVAEADGCLLFLRTCRASAGKGADPPCCFRIRALVTRARHHGTRQQGLLSPSSLLLSIRSGCCSHMPDLFFFLTQVVVKPLIWLRPPAHSRG